MLTAMSEQLHPRWFITLTRVPLPRRRRSGTGGTRSFLLTASRPTSYFSSPPISPPRYGIVSLGSVILKSRVVRCPLQDDIQSSLPPSVFLPPSQSLAVLLSFLFPCTHLFFVRSSKLFGSCVAVAQRERTGSPVSPTTITTTTTVGDFNLTKSKDISEGILLRS